MVVRGGGATVVVDVAGTARCMAIGALERVGSGGLGVVGTALGVAAVAVGTTEDGGAVVAGGVERCVTGLTDDRAAACPTE